MDVANAVNVLSRDIAFVEFFPVATAAVYFDAGDGETPAIIMTTATARKSFPGPFARFSARATTADVVCLVCVAMGCEGNE